MQVYQHLVCDSCVREFQNSNARKRIKCGEMNTCAWASYGVGHHDHPCVRIHARKVIYVFQELSSPRTCDFREFCSWNTEGKRFNRRCARDTRTQYFYPAARLISHLECDENERKPISPKLLYVVILWRRTPLPPLWSHRSIQHARPWRRLSWTCVATRRSRKRHTRTSRKSSKVRTTALVYASISIPESMPNQLVSVAFRSKEVRYTLPRSGEVFVASYWGRRFCGTGGQSYPLTQRFFTMSYEGAW